VRLCLPGVDGLGLGWESSRHQEMATVSSPYPPYRLSSRWGFNYAVFLNLAFSFLKKTTKYLSMKPDLFQFSSSCYLSLSWQGNKYEFINNMDFNKLEKYIESILLFIVSQLFNKKYLIFCLMHNN